MTAHDALDNRGRIRAADHLLLAPAQAPMAVPVPVLYATNHVHFSDDGARQRQRLAIEQVARLQAAGWPVVPLNVCRADDGLTIAGWHRAPALGTSIAERLGVSAPSKPTLREIFDVATSEATARGLTWFGYGNADIMPGSGAMELLSYADRNGYDAICGARHDVWIDPAGVARRGLVFTAGLDLFLLRTEFWRRIRPTVREYVIGEPAWDNVVPSVLASAGRVLLANTDAVLCHHPRHRQRWNVHSPLAAHNLSLAHGPDVDHYLCWVRYVRWRSDFVRRRGRLPRLIEQAAVGSRLLDVNAVHEAAA